VGFLGNADVLGVVGHTHEVHWRVDLDVVTQGMLDGLALSILEGVIRSGEAVAHEPRIYGPTGVDVLLTEVGVAIRVGLRRLLSIRRLGSLAGRRMLSNRRSPT